VGSIGYLILYVRDVDVSAAFYRDVVGLPLKLRDAGYAEFGLDPAGQRTAPRRPVLESVQLRPRSAT
jgi:catechol 2,3-dioxygenase-like lactoylglutathione lyase family enzyme